MDRIEAPNSKLQHPMKLSNSKLEEDELVVKKALLDS
jgi:hypothetical protein